MIRVEELQINRYFEFCGMYVRAIDFKGLMTLNNELKDLKPIELSEKILLKCGFSEGVLENDKYKISISYYDGWHFNYLEKEGFGSSEVYLYPASVSYLHQLQNLIHALTNEEITVNL